MANSLRSNADGTMSVLNGSGTEVANFPSTAPQQVNIGAKGITLGTAVTATGTAVDFTGIPSWAKRITVMFNGVSTNGTNSILVQIGATTISNTGYVGSSAATNNIGATYTTGFGMIFNVASSYIYGNMTIIQNGTDYISNHSYGFASNSVGICGGGSKSLGSTLDRIRITTVNGTDTFDAGTINIMYEG